MKHENSSESMMFNIGEVVIHDIREGAFEIYGLNGTYKEMIKNIDDVVYALNRNMYLLKILDFSKREDIVSEVERVNEAVESYAKELTELLVPLSDLKDKSEKVLKDINGKIGVFDEFEVLLSTHARSSDA